MVKKLIPALAALAVVAAGAWWFTSGTGGPSQTSINALGAQTAASPAADVDASLVPDMALGDPDAPITIIEYASFTCPHCATFHAQVLPQLKANYIETGKVHFIHREVYFDRYGLWAAMVARCGGEMRYFGLADRIYSTQSDWARHQDPAVAVEQLRRLGRAAGLNDDQLNACLENGEMAQAMVGVYQANAEADDVNSTPTLIVNGQKHGNMSYADLSALLDSLLAQ
ncbi:DsbA family protein [Plastorhodobacter daqingensis]|uniref:DsbA family protein n=1 Tax=Plastorhodobacter daqingensis TaxID=1387281 RepID=A0ABW2UE07_9RHOB